MCHIDRHRQHIQFSSSRESTSHLSALCQLQQLPVVERNFHLSSWFSNFQIVGDARFHTSLCYNFRKENPVKVHYNLFWPLTLWDGVTLGLGWPEGRLDRAIPLNRKRRWSTVLLIKCQRNSAYRWKARLISANSSPDLYCMRFEPNIFPTILNFRYPTEIDSKRKANSRIIEALTWFLQKG